MFIGEHEQIEMKLLNNNNVEFCASGGRAGPVLRTREAGNIGTRNRHGRGI